MRGYTCSHNNDYPRPLARRRVPLYLHPAAISASSCLIGLVMGFALASDSKPPAPPTPSVIYEGTSQPLGPDAVSGEGVYWVGRDIPPGLYRSDGNADSQCAWWVAKDAAGKKASVVAGKVRKGRGDVRLPAGAFFSTNECTTWRLVKRPEE